METNNTNPKKILLVEDEASVRDILSNKLKIEGFEVIFAKDGSSGYGIAMDQKPDLVIADILLPIMDGLELLKKLRNDGDWGRKVPIILLTNLSPDSEKINQAITENTPTYYLIKTDWSLQDIVQKVKESLKM